jgi:hypothetical protein
MEEIIAPESLPQLEKKPFLTEKRRITLIYVPLVMIASVIAGMVIGSRSPYIAFFDIAAGVTLNILAFSWCKIDAKEREYQLSKHFPLFVVLLGIFTVMYYLLRSRGVGRGLISIGRLILYIAGLFIALLVMVVVVVVPLLITGVLTKTVFN